MLKEIEATALPVPRVFFHESLSERDIPYEVIIRSENFAFALQQVGVPIRKIAALKIKATRASDVSASAYYTPLRHEIIFNCNGIWDYIQTYEGDIHKLLTDLSLHEIAHVADSARVLRWAQGAIAKVRGPYYHHKWQSKAERFADNLSAQFSPDVRGLSLFELISVRDK